MTELYPSDSDLNLLSGTSDSEQEVLYVATGESPYYTSFYKMLYRLMNVARRAGDLRVFKDGALTFGIRAGKFLNGDTTVSYAGSTGNALTNNQTNYIFLTVAGAVVTVNVNTTGFPTPSTTPHIPLATIVTAAGTYSHTNITDYRGRALMQICGNPGTPGLAEAQAFFNATDITGDEAETLTDGSNADTKHIHAAAGLAAALQDVIPYLTVAGADSGGGYGTATIQAKDAAGNNLAERVLVRTWISASDFGSPGSPTQFYGTTGTTLQTVALNKDAVVISNASGTVVMTIQLAGTWYVMAEIDGRIYSSGAFTITGP